MFPMPLSQLHTTVRGNRLTTRACIGPHTTFQGSTARHKRTWLVRAENEIGSSVKTNVQESQDYTAAANTTGVANGSDVEDVRAVAQSLQRAQSQRRSEGESAEAVAAFATRRYGTAAEANGPTASTSVSTLTPPANLTASANSSKTSPTSPARDSPSPSHGTTDTSSSSQPTSDATNEPTSSSAPATSSSGAGTGVLAGVGVAGGLVLLVAGGVVFREPIKAFLDFFIDAVDRWGPLGYLAYGVVYTGLEVLALPAIPLTMTAGVIFGQATGTGIVLVSATTAATIAFLIARYVARDRVMKFAESNPKFAAIDRAIGKDSLKVVTLLRLSPLLPFALSNYLYGLTSVDLTSYVIGSFFGMLPGTYAYVSAGHLGKAVLTEGEGMMSVEGWQVGLGVAATVLALSVIGQLAKKALEEADGTES